MTTTMTKKEYVTPAVEVFEFDAQESLLLDVSDSTYGKDEGEVELTNKRQPTSSPWDSSNWSTKE